ncbi:hypothetical protein Fmac_007352 [Flemingia macrophylla]|uniref:WAT1-related protein n=1 Tax=Flemingia macrophylla TaxID=520843 RepID=A0ABD1MUC4_9FABA
MNTCVFIFYRQLTGTVILVPLSLILERKRAVPVRLSFSTFCKIFVLSFFGVSVNLNMQAIALVYTSATLAAAIVNCLPASTFFFAVLLRMEKVHIRTKSGIAKIGSVLLCLLGVATLAFYKGPQLRTAHHILSRYHNHNEDLSSSKKWILGSLLLFLSVIIWSFWLTIQGYSAVEVGLELETAYSSLLWDTGDWSRLLLANLGDRKERTSFSSNVDPTEFYNCYNRFYIALGVLGGILLILSLYSVLWAKSKERMTHQTSLPLHSLKECEEVKTEASSTEAPH